MTTMVGGHGFPYRWNPRHRARVGLMPRGETQADIIWCDVDPAYVLHVANACDLPDGRAVIAVVAYATMFAGSHGGPDTRSRGLERWTVDSIGRSVDVHTIDDAAQEFPRMDERCFGQPYRYAYTMALEETDGFAIGCGLYKDDLVAGTREVHNLGVARRPGEFAFVPAHEGAGEDEGWLIGLVIDMEAETTDLAIIDARRFEEAPVASVRLPHRVPPGFHGNWMPTGGDR